MKPTMNAACVSKCAKGGTSRGQCMKKCYPEGNGKKGGEAGKKPSRSRRSSY